MIRRTNSIAINRAMKNMPKGIPRMMGVAELANNQ
jgi:hypothetical protein